MTGDRTAPGAHRMSPSLGLISSTGWIAITLLLTAVGLLVRPTADDYSNFLQIEKFPDALSYTHHMYLTWTGRLSSTFALGLLLKHLDLSRFISALLAVGLGLLGPLMLQAIYGRRISSDSSANLIVTCGIVLALTNVIGQCVLWPTGGLVYLAPLLLAVAWVPWMRRVVLSPKPRIICFVLVPLSGFVIALGHEQLSLPLLFIGILPLVFFSPGNASLKVSLVVVLLFGALIVILAPGNYVRAHYGVNLFQSRVLDHWRQLLRVNVQAMSFSALAVALGALSGFLVRFSRSNNDWLLQSSGRWIPPRHTMLLLILAELSLAPVMPVPGFVVNRVFFFPAIFLFFAAFAWVVQIPLPTLGLARSGARAVSTLLATGTAVFLMIQLIQARDLARELGERTRIFESNRGRDMALVVDPIAASVPKLIHVNDISRDPENWINKAVAKYYGLESIRVR